MIKKTGNDDDNDDDWFCVFDKKFDWVKFDAIELAARLGRPAIGLSCAQNLG